MDLQAVCTVLSAADIASTGNWSLARFFPGIFEEHLHFLSLSLILVLI